MNTINLFYSDISQQIHLIYFFKSIITQIWHRGKWYFTCISHTWCLTTVPNKNKINKFFSHVYHYKHKMYDKMAIITAILYNYTIYDKLTYYATPRYHSKHTKCIFKNAIITTICHRTKWYFTCISNTWYLISVPNMNEINAFFFAISQQTSKMYEKVAIVYS